MIKNIVTGTTGDYENELKKLRLAFERSDAVIIGAGSGLSASAGYDFSGERLKKHFGDFVQKYGMTHLSGAKVGTLHITATRNICPIMKPAGFYTLN